MSVSEAGSATTSDGDDAQWLNFPRVRILVCLPVSLTRGDGTPVDSSATPIVTNPIMEAIASVGEHGRTVASDEVYRQAEKDFERFSPKRNTQA